jgi:hypothetical protein
LNVSTDLMIHQNTMAFVNIPKDDISGMFYVVGVTRQGSMGEGNIQTVRLREKFYAISGRIPPDPEEDEDPGLNQTAPGDVKAQLPGVRWGNAFAAAAMQYHNGWDFKLFLGVLLAICDQESSFQTASRVGKSTGIRRLRLELQFHRRLARLGFLHRRSMDGRKFGQTKLNHRC